MKHRRQNLRCALLCAALFAAPLAAAAEAAARPNIVLIVADDLGWADVGFHGGAVATPTIDQLAREGVELARFYAAPSCTAARAALMTGRNPYRLGLAYAAIMPWSGNGVHPEERFLPEALREAGYQTAMFGKWHLGHAQASYLPRQRGFEHFYGHLLTEVGYQAPYSAQGGVDFQRNGRTINETGYETFMLTDEAARWLAKRDRERPAFIYLSFLAPHTPLSAPPEYLAQYRGMKDERQPARSPVDRISQRAKAAGAPSLRPVYAAAVTAMDAAIGALLRTLAREDMADNTLLLFLSDNGGQAIYGAGGADNGPWRGGKGEVFEGGIRTVALAHWPGRLAGGGRFGDTMSAMDVFPTLMAAAGIAGTGAAKALDGVNVWPALSTQTASAAKDSQAASSQDSPAQAAQIKSKSKSERAEPLFFAQESPGFGSLKHALIDGDWKLVELIEQDLEQTSIRRMLFNLADDPYEYKDLAAEHPERVAQMAKVIRAWRGRYPVGGTRANLVPPPGWRAPIDWATYPAALDILQPNPAPGMGDPRARRMMDKALRGRATLIYE